MENGELKDELLSYTGLPGQMHKSDVKIGVPLNYAAHDRQDKVYLRSVSSTDTDYGNWNTKRPVFLILVSTTLYAELYLSINRKWSQKNDYLGV